MLVDKFSDHLKKQVGFYQISVDRGWMNYDSVPAEIRHLIKPPVKKRDLPAGDYFPWNPDPWQINK